ncbi:ClbS/DfsB family four-helix bundle protein [bacterium]|nr:MAG: ClbS/DfsB family four-helix bundle protein [bacterium]
MTRDELLHQMEENRAQLIAQMDGIPANVLTQPGAYGVWSVKDVLVHISRWEAEVIKVLYQAGQGARPESEVFNPEFLQVNEVWYQEGKERELERVEDDFHSVRVQLVRRLSDYPEKWLSDPAKYPWMKNHPLIDLVKDIVLDHEEEHLQGLKAWRAALPA